MMYEFVWWFIGLSTILVVAYVAYKVGKVYGREEAHIAMEDRWRELHKYRLAEQLRLSE